MIHEMRSKRKRKSKGRKNISKLLDGRDIENGEQKEQESQVKLKNEEKITYREIHRATTKINTERPPDCDKVKMEQKWNEKLPQTGGLT